MAKTEKIKEGIYLVTFENEMPRICRRCGHFGAMYTISFGPGGICYACKAESILEAKRLYNRTMESAMKKA